MRIRTLVLAACTTLLLSACSIGNKITVDSISVKESPASYRLLSGMPDTKSNDLYFQEYSRLFRQALASRGYTESTGENADIVVFLSYGIGNEQTSYQTYTTPVYGITGGQSYSVVESTNNTRTVRDVYIPVQQRIIGRELHTRSYTTYTAYAVLEARTSADQSGEPVWKTTIQMQTDKPELRSIIPKLANAATPYIGTNTGRTIEVKPGKK